VGGWVCEGQWAFEHGRDRRTKDRMPVVERRGTCTVPKFASSESDTISCFSFFALLAGAMALRPPVVRRAASRGGRLVVALRVDLEITGR
jgi:hypothetical protein